MTRLSREVCAFVKQDDLTRSIVPFMFILSQSKIRWGLEGGKAQVRLEIYEHDSNGEWVILCVRQAMPPRLSEPSHFFFIYKIQTHTFERIQCSFHSLLTIPSFFKIFYIYYFHIRSNIFIAFTISIFFFLEHISNYVWHYLQARVIRADGKYNLLKTNLFKTNEI